MEDDTDPKYSENLMEINISNIQRDTERLRLAKQLTATEDDMTATTPKDDDNLSHYTTETEEGVKVLDTTSSINRKAIFHDLGRLKSWRESVDKEKEDGGRSNDLSLEETINEEHMEKNIDSLLGELPDVGGCEGGGKIFEVSGGAEKKLCELENKINSRHLNMGKKI